MFDHGEGVVHVLLRSFQLCLWLRQCVEAFGDVDPTTLPLFLVFLVDLNIFAQVLTLNRREIRDGCSSIEEFAYRRALADVRKIGVLLKHHLVIFPCEQ